ncbi:YciI family protein [Aliamphritea hakodatensis]|uniref:YciI family protein n=1 Tax=Aliamphritea hakodatensis TaxID=2895352 RepID=UPI0022FD71BF|nr:YciI family protein [Aliamphritea hakodatensis]
MFIVSITYQRPLSEIEACLEEHIAFLNHHYASGTFLASGPKQPRTGGVILATATTREALETILEEDPFKREQLAHYEITEWLANRSTPGLEPLLNT